MPRHLALVVCASAAIFTFAAQAAEADEPGKRLYVSLGDSYGTGWQPAGVGQGRNTRNGFAYQVPAIAARRGYRLTLINFACVSWRSGVSSTPPCGRRTRQPAHGSST